jgi:hypothetical protein
MSDLSEGELRMPTSGQPKPAIESSLMSELRDCVQDTQPPLDPSARLTPAQQLALFGQMLTAGSSQHVGDRRSAAVHALKGHIARFGDLDIPLESLLPTAIYKTLFSVRQRSKSRKSNESEMTLVDEMAADDEEGSAKGNTNQTDAHKLVRFESESEGTSAALE